MNFLTDFNQKIILEDDVVLLRPLELSDFNHLVHFPKTESVLWHYSLIRPDSEDNLAKYLQLAISDRAGKTAYPFIVFDKRVSAYAGSTRFYDINPDYKTLQLGYTWYGKDFQRSGLNKHCKFLLLQYAFETLAIERVEFRADNENLQSIAAMKSIGCRVEGILKSHMPTFEGGRRDTIVLSILKDDWFETVKDKIRNQL